MRVALITRDYPPVTGGISTHVSNVERGLKRLGVDVDVVVGRTDLKSLLLPLTHSFDGYDVVHVQSSPYGAFVRGSALVVTVHAPVLVEMSHYDLPSLLKSFPAFLMESLAFRKASAVLAVSQATASDLVARYRIRRERIVVIGNGVDYQRFLAQDEGRRVKKRVLLVSRLEPRKNVEESLRALARMPKESYEAQIVGSGSQGVKLRALGKSLGLNTAFLDSVDEATLPDVYREASIFLTSSYSEGFGLSLLEALSAGCAVIASNIPAHRYLIRHGYNGLLYGYPEELQSQLSALLKNPSEARRLGAMGMATAKEFSWESVSRRVLQVYQSCIAR